MIDKIILAFSLVRSISKPYSSTDLHQCAFVSFFRLNVLSGEESAAKHEDYIAVLDRSCGEESISVNYGWLNGNIWMHPSLALFITSQNQRSTPAILRVSGTGPRFSRSWYFCRISQDLGGGFLSPWPTLPRRGTDLSSWMLLLGVRAVSPVVPR